MCERFCVCVVVQQESFSQLFRGAYPSLVAVVDAVGLTELLRRLVPPAMVSYTNQPSNEEFPSTTPLATSR
jgi:hypothetical protein